MPLGKTDGDRITPMIKILQNKFKELNELIATFFILFYFYHTSCRCLQP